MTSAKEALRKKVDQLSEEEALEVLRLIATKESGRTTGSGVCLTREVIRERLAGKPTFRLPPPGAAPRRMGKRIQCPGIPASELLIADRR